MRPGAGRLAGALPPATPMMLAGILAAALIALAALTALAGGAAQAQGGHGDWEDGFAPIPPVRDMVDPTTLDDPQLQRGHAVFRRECAHCHGAGRGMPGTAALNVKYGDTLPALLEERADLTSELTAFFVRNGVLSMAPYRKTEISDAELADLGAYLARPR